MLGGPSTAQSRRDARESLHRVAWGVKDQGDGISVRLVANRVRRSAGERNDLSRAGGQTLYRCVKPSRVEREPLLKGWYLNWKLGSRSSWARTAPTPAARILRLFGVGSPRAPDRTKEAHVNPCRCHHVLPSRLRTA